MRPRHLKAPVAATLVLLALAAAAAAEVVTLRDGDRITGRIASETPRLVRLQTEYGLLRIPRARIATIVRADGKEEVVNAKDAKAPALVPAAPEKPRLVLTVTGTTFWQAWDRKEAPADPSLRLEVRIDEETVATFTDGKLDPREIPGAVVNAFSFAPGDVQAGFVAPVDVAAPEVSRGRIVLRLELPPSATGEHQLRIAYQVNSGTRDEPAWREAVGSTVKIALRPDPPTVVEVRQERGRMGFSGLLKKRMRNVETFRLALTPG